MANFDRNRNRQGGGFNRGFGGNKSFGGGKRFGGRDGAKTMHKAICSECGYACEVPFKPTGDRPIYCSNCFGKQDGGNARSNKFGGDRGGKQIYDAVCDKCGQTCQIPFRPTAGKPVYCNNCFGKGGNINQHSGDVMSEIKKLNAKIDELIKILAPKNSVTKTEPIATVKEIKAKKPAKEKKAKTAPKKSAAKKKK
ncbi:MAG: CxxC-x17-CxxC domain-containing protein [Patescibacteria group bacterium]